MKHWTKMKNRNDKVCTDLIFSQHHRSSPPKPHPFNPAVLYYLDTDLVPVGEPPSISCIYLVVFKVLGCLAAGERRLRAKRERFVVERKEAEKRPTERPTMRASTIDFISAFSTGEQTEYLSETIQASGSLPPNDTSPVITALITVMSDLTYAIGLLISPISPAAISITNIFKAIKGVWMAGKWLLCCE